MIVPRSTIETALIRGMYLACACLIAGTAAQAAKFNRVVEIGQSSPDWKDLEGTDGRKHSLTSYSAAKVLVVVITCNHCPYAKVYENRLMRLAVDNAKRKVQVVAISVSLSDADTLEAMEKRATEKKYPFDYLHDPSQKVAKDYGALATPTVFLLNEKRQIAYMGKIDDSPDPDDVTEHFLRDAIDAVLAGREPEVQETKAVGCPVIYE